MAIDWLAAGGALMGLGGALAQGCTIGQGLSGATTLSISAPIFVLSLLLVLGAKLGLMHLIEGRLLWHFGRSTPPRDRPDRARAPQVTPISDFDCLAIALRLHYLRGRETAEFKSGAWLHATTF